MLTARLRILHDRLWRCVLPAGADNAARVLLISRGLRGLCDGYVAILLPAYLLALGLGKVDVGLVSTATLIGSAVATIAVGALAHRFAARRMFMVAAALMIATGTHTRVSELLAMRMMFLLYALTGIAIWLLYRRLPRTPPHTDRRSAPLGQSRRIVTRLALLFSERVMLSGNG